MLVIRGPKNFHFNYNLPKDIDKNLRHEIQFIIKHNESLAEYKIKNEIKHILSKNSKTRKLHKFFLNLS